uniref:AAA+ ATPase domain-containing protein n=1 Tax=Pleonosporium borreri TaxID=2575635 RepID=A0A4D6WVM0_9FLOR|nr:hypothetical protein [Pleonosporium borreri]
MLVADDLDKLLDILPDFIRNSLEKHSNRKNLIEIVMDLGRRPEARFPHGPEYLSKKTISWYHLDYCIKKIGHFNGDNRSGIEYTLHRISSIRNRQGKIVGLTCRVGRAIFGTIGIIRDLLETGQSLLLLGRPGVGKTTAIREIARVLADEMEKRVVIIDTSNEIAGDGDIPHPAIGRARRMQVMRPELQHQVMIEAVENHMPEVIIIDEIGTELEVLAARTIAERGVQLVGTVHGNYLQSLIKNPILSDLVGGIEYVTLGDEEAKRRGSQKSIIERKALPAFQVAIEIHQRDSWIVHERVEQVVDQILQGSTLFIQRRKLNRDGTVLIQCENSNYNDTLSINYNMINLDLKTQVKYSIGQSNIKNHHSLDILNKQSIDVPSYNNKNNISLKQRYENSIILYSYGINIKLIENIINTLKFAFIITKDVMKADIIIALKSNIRKNHKIHQLAKYKKIIIYTIQSNTVANITRALKDMLKFNTLHDLFYYRLSKNKSVSQINALLEVKLAIEKILIPNKQSVELLPYGSSIRKLQYQLINMYNFTVRIIGEEPNIRLRIYPC